MSLLDVLSAILGLLALYFLVQTVAFVLRPRRKQEISWLRNVPYSLLLAVGLGILGVGSIAAVYLNNADIITSTVSLLIVVGSLIVQRICSPTS